MNESPHPCTSVPELGKEPCPVLVHSQGFHSPDGVGDTQQGCAHRMRATIANTLVEMAKQNLVKKW